jgi:hypothetical protein
LVAAGWEEAPVKVREENRWFGARRERGGESVARNAKCRIGHWKNEKKKARHSTQVVDFPLIRVVFLVRIA